MRYQLWDMISYGNGDPLTPFTLLKESLIFDDIYTEFNNRKNPCVIILKEVSENLEVDKKSKIYESPDKGNSVFERNFGDYNNKKKIK